MESELDLSYLSDKERRRVQAVLERDAQIQKKEEQRLEFVKLLVLVVLSIFQLDCIFLILFCSIHSDKNNFLVNFQYFGFMLVIMSILTIKNIII